MTALDRFAGESLNATCGWGEATAIVSAIVGYCGVGLSERDLWTAGGVA